MDCKKELRRARIIRLSYAIPSESLLAAISSGAAILALATKLAFPNLDQHPHLFVFVVLIIALAATVVFVTIVLLVFRIYVEYQRRTFDGSTITPLVTLYESDAMESKFTLAAQKDS